MNHAAHDAFDLEKELLPFDREAALAMPNPFVVLDPKGAALQKYRIITFYGGRGSGKTFAVAGFIPYVMDMTKINVLACREFQNSIEDSSKKELETAIEAQGIDSRFSITNSEISHKRTESRVTFKGLRNNINSIKSISDIGLVWGEEFQTTSKNSLEILLPSIRRPGNRIVITMNPEQEDAYVYEEFIAKAGSPGYEDRLAIQVNYNSNPYFTESLESDRQTALMRIVNAPNEDAKQQAIADYCWIWLGHTKRIAGAAVLKRWQVRYFEAPIGMEYYHGADWSNGGADPTCGVRCFEALDEMGQLSLWIDYEVYANNASIDDLPGLFDSIPTLNRAKRITSVPRWLLRADSSLPLAINKMKESGFKCEGAVKAPNSVEDGIAHLNNYNRIFIHPRCKNTVREFTNYKWRVDRMSGEILPVLADGNDHIPDAVRYALEHKSGKKNGGFFTTSTSIKQFRWDSTQKAFVKK